MMADNKQIALFTCVRGELLSTIVDDTHLPPTQNNRDIVDYML